MLIHNNHCVSLMKICHNFRWLGYFCCHKIQFLRALKGMPVLSKILSLLSPLDLMLWVESQLHLESVCCLRAFLECEQFWVSTLGWASSCVSVKGTLGLLFWIIQYTTLIFLVVKFKPFFVHLIHYIWRWGGVRK